MCTIDLLGLNQHWASRCLLQSSKCDMSEGLFHTVEWRDGVIVISIPPIKLVLVYCYYVHISLICLSAYW